MSLLRNDPGPQGGSGLVRPLRWSYGWQVTEVFSPALSSATLHCESLILYANLRRKSQERRSEGIRRQGRTRLNAVMETLSVG